MPANTNSRSVRIPSSDRIRAPAVDTNVDPGMHDTGGAAMFDQAADHLGRMSRKVGALADHAAAKEGDEAGARDGLDPEFRPTKNLTIRGEAYDQAGIQVASKRLRMEMSADMDMAYQQYGNDPKRLKAALDGRAQAWASQGFALSGKVGASLSLSFQQGSLSLMRRSTRAQATRISAAHRETSVADVADRLKRIGHEAYDAGLDEAADASIASSRLGLMESLGAVSIKGKSLFSKKQKKAALSEFDGTVLRARMRGVMSRTGGLGAKAAIIDKFEQDWSKGKYPELGLKDFDKVNGQLYRDLNRDKASAGVAVRASVKKISFLVDQAKDGHVVNEDQRSDMLSEIRASGDQGIALAAEADRNLVMLDQMRIQPPAVINEKIEQERALGAKEGMTPSRLASIELAEGLRDEARKELKRDPLGWVERTGQMDIKPLDDKNPESLTLRVSQAEEVGQKYGQSPKYLRPDEKVTMLAMMKQGPQGLAQVVAYVSAGAGPAARHVMGELSDMAPALAHIGGLAVGNGDPQAVANLAIWQRQLSDGKYKSRLLPADEKKWSMESAGSVFTGNLQLQKTIGRVAAGLADILAKKRQAPKVTKEIYDEAFNQVLGQRKIDDVIYGGMITYGDSKIVIPSYVRADAFEQIIESVHEGTLEHMGWPLHGNGAAAKPADIKRSIFTSLGDGRYLVNYGSKEEPQYFKGDNGPRGTWVFDMKSFYTSRSLPNTDWFLGRPN